MMPVEEFYMFQNYLNNLLMFKYVHDEGIDLSQFYNCELSNYNGYQYMSDEGYSNFMSIVEVVFELSDAYDSYDNERLEDKKFWSQEANANVAISDSHGIIVLLDYSLRIAETGEVGYSETTDNAANIYQIEEGVVIVYDTDYGDINWTEMIYTLLQSRKRVLILPKEEIKYEVAV